MFNQSKKKIEALQAELELARSELKDIKEKMTRNFEFLDDVDFDMSLACSIERRVNPESNWYLTIIGYKNNKGVLQEWYLAVSDKKHKELVEQFTASKNNALQKDTDFSARLEQALCKISALPEVFTSAVDEIDEEAYLKRAMETGAALFDNIIRAVREIKD